MRTGPYGKLPAVPVPVYTLAVRGGPVNAAEVTAFGARPHARAAVAVRRWDEEAKDPVGPTPEFGPFRALLSGLTRRPEGESGR